MLGVIDPGIVTLLTPSPALIPARASVPLSPLIPPEASPVVHCISPSAYRNITNDSVKVVASTHCNVLVYRIKYVYIDMAHTVATYIICST